MDDFEKIQEIHKEIRKLSNKLNDLVKQNNELNTNLALNERHIEETETEMALLNREAELWVKKIELESIGN